MKNILMFGGLLLDRYIYIDRWPNRGQDGYILDEVDYVGGCAVNMAVTTDNLIRKYGKEDMAVHVISAVGKDQTAKKIRDYMNKHHLSSDFIFEQDGTTGSCIVFSEKDGERTFLTRKGVEAAFTAQISEKIKQTGAIAVGLTGYYLLGEQAGEIMACIRALKEQGAILLFDPSPLVGDIPFTILKEAWDLADIVTPNITELELMKECGVISEITYGNRTIVQKEGSDGGIVFTQDGTFHFSSVKQEVVDTTGAGDSFSGALLYAFASGMKIEQAIELAAKCASITVGMQGPHGFW